MTAYKSFVANIITQVISVLFHYYIGTIMKKTLQERNNYATETKD